MWHCCSVTQCSNGDKSGALQPSLIGYNCFFYLGSIEILSPLSIICVFWQQQISLCFCCCFSSLLLLKRFGLFCTGCCIPNFIGGTAVFICAMNSCRYLLCIQRRQACYATPCLNTSTLLCVVMKEYNSSRPSKQLEYCTTYTSAPPSPLFWQAWKKKKKKFFFLKCNVCCLYPFCAGWFWSLFYNVPSTSPLFCKIGLWKHLALYK